MKTAATHFTKTVSVPSAGRLQLGCLAASPAAVRAAVDNGADWVRVPCRPTGAACDTALQDFIIGRLGKAIRYAHHKKRKVVLDLNFSATQPMWPYLRKMISRASDEGIDALMLSDPALAIYCRVQQPNLALHLAVSSAVTGKAARQLQFQLGAARVLLPPTLSLAGIGELAAIRGLELEVLGFGCGAALTAGQPEDIRVEGGATLCGDSDQDASNDPCYSPTRLAAGALRHLPRLAALGIRTIQIEPRIEAPGEVAQATRVWRAAIDKCLDDAAHYAVNPSWIRQLDALRGAQ